MTGDCLDPPAPRGGPARRWVGGLAGAAAGAAGFFVHWHNDTPAEFGWAVILELVMLAGLGGLVGLAGGAVADSGGHLRPGVADELW